ncbi:MAG: hypothetical protein ABIN67_01215 [Ferruginibacter sp.]
MSNYKIFTRRTMGLDNRVWRTMIILGAVSLLLLSYTIIDREDCSPITFDVGSRTHLNDSIYYTNENIAFNSSVSSANLTWDFNDNTDHIFGKAFTTHKFTKEGKYYVTASTRQGCEFGRLITIKSRPAESSVTSIAKRREVVGTASTFTGREEEFISPALADSFYEWIVLYHPEMGRRETEKAKFQFAIPGKYIIQLTLDHDRIKSYTKQVSVEETSKPKTKLPGDVVPLIKDAPPIPEKEPEVIAPPPVAPPVQNTTPTVTKPKNIFVADEIFKSHLQSLVEKEKTEADFYKYLCGTGSTPVIVDGKKNEPKTFSWLCQELYGRTTKPLLGKRRSVKIETVKLSRDENNCVTRIDVNY